MYSRHDFEKQMNVSRETLDKFITYGELLRKWQKSVNLVSNKTLDDLWRRHMLDSAQLVEYIDNKDIEIVDIGSGAGFPGLVLSVLGYDVTMIESDTKKCLFLKEVIRQLSLPAVVENCRIEDAQHTANLLTARALAPLTDLLRYSENLIDADGTCLFQKGRTVEQEIIDARKDGWNFDIQKYESIASEDSYVIELKNVSRETL
jgi:16S rRNA (guanine527-N7)-methyltransferase